MRTWTVIRLSARRVIGAFGDGLRLTEPLIEVDRLRCIANSVGSVHF